MCYNPVILPQNFAIAAFSANMFSNPNAQRYVPINTGNHKKYRYKNTYFCFTISTLSTLNVIHTWNRRWSHKNIADLENICCHTELCWRTMTLLRFRYITILSHHTTHQSVMNSRFFQQMSLALPWEGAKWDYIKKVLFEKK